MQKLLTTLLITLFLSLPVKADTHLPPVPEPEFDFWWSNMPSVCGMRDEFG